MVIMDLVNFNHFVQSVLVMHKLKHKVKERNYYVLDFDLSRKSVSAAFQLRGLSDLQAPLNSRNNAPDVANDKAN